jgi:tetratricopeptide (TPR) repeat protein
MPRSAAGLRSFSRGLAYLGLIAACLAVGPIEHVRAQGPITGHSMGVRDEMPPDELPGPQRMSGIGNIEMQITSSPEAQMWFNQGLNLLHDFWDYESAKAFEQSIRVDPQCAMCYWGLYEAEASFHSTTKHYAGQALAKAVSLEAHVSKTERLYIEASAARERALKAANQEPDSSQEVKLWGELVKYRPKDWQARIFLAEAIGDGYDDKGEPRARQKEALAILQGVLKDEPENSAANHYWIHAVEASAHPEQALRSAEILASLAPASGHMVHMPGHIFYRMGDYARAQGAFTASMEADERYVQAQHVQPDDDWNYVHNLMYAIANLMEEGRLKEATALSLKLTGSRGQLETTLYPWSTRDSISRLDPRLPLALRMADWAQALELLKSVPIPAGLPSLGFLARELSEFATGMQALETENVMEAEEASARLDAELWRVSQQLKDAAAGKTNEAEMASAGKLQVMPDALPQSLVNYLSIMSLELRASVLAARGQTDEAKQLFARADQEEKALGYREPPGYIRPVGETEGAALMAVGDWTDAKSAYNGALRERPRSGFPLYGIALSSEKAGEAEAAAAGYAEFVAAWKNADPELAQLQHARAYLAEHGRAVADR